MWSAWDAVDFFSVSSRSYFRSRLSEDVSVGRFRRWGRSLHPIVLPDRPLLVAGSRSNESNGVPIVATSAHLR